MKISAVPRWAIVLLTFCCTMAAVSVQAQSRQSIFRYESVHQPILASYGMAVSQNDLASEVGRDILAAGGNAVDAAVAMGFALAVTLPRAGNLGGSGFMLVHLSDEAKTVALDYRSTAPGASDPSIFLDENGELDRRAVTYGARAPAVPGTVAGLHEAWKRWGSLPWKDLVEPAKRLASDGIVVSYDLSFALSQAAVSMREYPATKSIYLRPDGEAWQPGERLVQKDLAWSLGQIGAHGAEAFYRGDLAAKIISAFQAEDGLMTAEDLDQYAVRERAPVGTDYRGYRVVSMPPVSAGGATLIQMLNMLSEFDVAGLGAGSIKGVHLLAEVMKRAAANRRTWLGDPDFHPVPLAEFTDPAVGKAMAKTIDMDRAAPVESVEPWPLGIQESHDTTHYSVMDAQGNAVSNTYTLGYSFGSAWVASGTGILFDNQMRNFSYDKGTDHPNAIKPGKRMLSTMTPTLVLDGEGNVELVTGSPGGSYIINVVLQILVNVIDHGMNIAEATHRPRMYQGWNRSVMGLEPGFSPDVIAGLEQLGHETQTERTMGSTQSIRFLDGRYYGSADPRRPNAAAMGLMYPPAQHELKRAVGDR